MSNRRISINDYPEHLNPFNEFYNEGLATGHNVKYHTWSSSKRHKIKQAFLDKSWSAMSPIKLGRKLSFIKAVTVDKLSPRKNKHKLRSVQSANALPLPVKDETEPYLIISPKQKEKMRQLALKSSSTQSSDSESKSITRVQTMTSSLPTRRKLSFQKQKTPFDDNDTLNEITLEKKHCKSRKKRVAPSPPLEKSCLDNLDSSNSDGDVSTSPDNSISEILEKDADAVEQQVQQ